MQLTLHQVDLWLVEGNPIVEFLAASAAWPIAVAIVVHGDCTARDSNLGLDFAKLGTKQPLKVFIVVPNFLHSPLFDRLLSFSGFFLERDSSLFCDDL